MSSESTRHFTSIQFLGAPTLARGTLTGIMDAGSCVTRSGLNELDIYEVYVVCGGVDNCEEKDRISNLPVKEDVLIQGKQPG